MTKFLIVAFTLFSFQFFSQSPLNPVTWSVVYNELSSSEGELVYTASIEYKWHIYSQRITDAGPVPTSFSVTKDSLNFSVIGQVEEENAHEEYVTAFEAKVYVFDNKAVFKQKIKRKTKSAFVVKTSLEYMCCNDSKCLPPKTLDFTVSVPAKTVLKSKL